MGSFHIDESPILLLLFLLLIFTPYPMSFWNTNLLSLATLWTTNCFLWDMGIDQFMFSKPSGGWERSESKSTERSSIRISKSRECEELFGGSGRYGVTFVRDSWLRTGTKLTGSQCIQSKVSENKERMYEESVVTLLLSCLNYCRFISVCLLKRPSRI